MLKNLKNHSVLYVEDEPEIQANIAEYLNNYFAAVYLAKNGTEALSQYKKCQPDVLLLDINLPFLDGLSVAREVRKTNHKIKIIMLTAYTEKEQLLRATELKLTKYLVKPIAPKEFKDSLKLLANELQRDSIDNSPANLHTQCDYPIKVKTLGVFELYIKGELLTFERKSPKKILALLKLIIALGGTDIAINKLIDKLWPDSEGDAAKSAFDSALQRLRKLLDDDNALILHDSHLTLNSDHCWVDAFALEELIETKSALTEQEIKKMLNLYQGMFLKDQESFWADQFRQKLHRKVIHCLEMLSEKISRNASFNKKEEELLEKILNIAPHAEIFYQHLMQFHIRQGSKAEAIMVYQRCKKILKYELDVIPSEKTQQLFLNSHV